MSEPQLYISGRPLFIKYRGCEDFVNSGDKQRRPQKLVHMWVCGSVSGSGVIYWNFPTQRLLLLADRASFSFGRRSSKVVNGSLNCGNRFCRMQLSNA